VVLFQILLDGAEPRDAGTTWLSLQSTDLPQRELNSVLFSLAYSPMCGFLCCKQTCTKTVIHYWKNDRQLISLTPAVIDL